MLIESAATSSFIKLIDKSCCFRVWFFRMKSLAFLSLFALVAVFEVNAQYYSVEGTLSGGEPHAVDIPDGMVFEVVSLKYSRYAPKVAIGATAMGSTGPDWKFTHVGPATINFSLPSDIAGDFVVTYRLFENATPIGIPSTAVVIPADAIGPVEVILESSVDLITWVTASPGQYGASTSRRFFRIRAITHIE